MEDSDKMKDWPNPKRLYCCGARRVNVEFEATELARGASKYTHSRTRVTELDRSSGVQLDSHPIGFGRGMAEPVIAYRAQSSRQHVA